MQALPRSCERRLLSVRWLPQPKRIEQMAQVRTFKGSPPGAVIAKNGFFPAIFSQSVFFSVGVRSVRKKSRRPAKTLRELKFSSGIPARVGIRAGQSDAPTRIRPRFLGPGRVRTEGSCSGTGPGSCSVSRVLIVGRIILSLSSTPRNVGSGQRLSRRGRLFNMKWD